MISDYLNPLLAKIPYLDMSGTQFLKAYGIAFIIAILGSLSLKRKMMARFQRPDSHDPQISDPYELAFLAGGIPRCSQLAVVRLLHADAVEWKTSLIKGTRLVAKNNSVPMDEIERTLYVGILNYGVKGMPLASVPVLIGTRLRGIESKLATLGLRPTRQERSGLKLSITWPLVILAIIGVIKIFIGISRGKPVLFLAIAIVLTVLATLLVASIRKHLTPAGEALLRRKGEEHSTIRNGAAADIMAMSTGVALLGPASIGAFGFQFDSPGFQREIRGLGNLVNGGSSGGGGCGGSDGGGGGGCGGGGCGGCGGGGGD